MKTGTQNFHGEVKRALDTVEAAWEAWLDSESHDSMSVYMRGQIAQETGATTARLYVLMSLLEAVANVQVKN